MQVAAVAALVHSISIYGRQASDLFHVISPPLPSSPLSLSFYFLFSFPFSSMLPPPPFITSILLFMSCPLLFSPTLTPHPWPPLLHLPFIFSSLPQSSACLSSLRFSSSPLTFPPHHCPPLLCLPFFTSSSSHLPIILPPFIPPLLSHRRSYPLTSPLPTPLLLLSSQSFHHFRFLLLLCLSIWLTGVQRNYATNKQSFRRTSPPGLPPQPVRRLVVFIQGHALPLISRSGRALLLLLNFTKHHRCVVVRVKRIRPDVVHQAGGG